MHTHATISPHTTKNGRGPVVDFLLITAIFAIYSVTAVLSFLFIFRPRSTAVPQDTSLLQATDYNDPIQSSVAGEVVAPIVREENGMTWTMQPRAGCRIAARVLGNKRYSDWQSGIIPRDLALAWGDIGDPSVDRWIHWRQSGRWYYYEWDSGDYGRSYITSHSANIHIISATENLDKALRQVQKDDLV